MRTQNTKTVLLTAGRSFITLDLARQFHAAGHRVIVVESTTQCICKASRSVDKFYVTPSPRFAQESYIQTLVNVVESEKVDLLIPVWEDVLYISRELHRFPKHCQVFCQSFEQLDSLHNKWLYNEKLRNYGFDVIPTELISTVEDLNRLQRSQAYALKQVYSRASQQVKKVQPGESTPDVVIPEHNPWIAQDWIEGEKYCSYAICHEGDVHAFSIYPVEVAIDGHSCLSFRSIEHPGIAAWMKRFARLENFTGQISFDFVETPDGRILSWECNPRATSGVHLFSPEQGLPAAFLRQNEEILRPAFSVKRQLFMAMLFYGWTAPFSRKKPLHYLKKLVSSRDVIAGVGRDIKPLLFSPRIYWYYWRLSKKLGISIPAAFTYDMDWNAELESEPFSREYSSTA